MSSDNAAPILRDLNLHAEPTLVEPNIHSGCPQFDLEQAPWPWRWVSYKASVFARSTHLRGVVAAFLSPASSGAFRSRAELI